MQLESLLSFEDEAWDGQGRGMGWARTRHGMGAARGGMLPTWRRVAGTPPSHERATRAAAVRLQPGHSGITCFHDTVEKSVPQSGNSSESAVLTESHIATCGAHYRWPAAWDKFRTYFLSLHTHHSIRQLSVFERVGKASLRTE
jgi:hypothetical protein